MIANGAVVGIATALTGAVVGLAAWFGYAPRLQASTGHRIPPLHLPWWVIGTGMALAVVTAVLAVPGIVLLVAGPILLALSGGWGSSNELQALLGLGATILGLLFVAPACLSVLAVASRHAPVAVRLALRDLARYRARSRSALAAISFAVLLAVFISILATARYADAVDYFGPNLRSNQLIVYDHAADQSGPGEPASAPARDLPAKADAIAAAVGRSDILELDSTAGADVMLVQSRNNGFWGAGRQLYVATPALLARYGIAPDRVDPNADLLTSRTGLTQASILIALGVLAMTVGLIRGEAAGDLRTLSATGANRRIRRSLTGVTAGSLGLLGAVLGTAAACLAAICYYRSNLSTTVSHVPVADLIAVLAGLPLAATLGGWLSAGREPHAIAQEPLE